MNSSIIGLGLGLGVLYLGLHETSPDNMMMFADFHSSVIVIGGTTAAASISYPISQVLMLLKVFFMRVLGKRKMDYVTIIQQYIDLNKKAVNGVSGLNEVLPNIKNIFMREAVGLVATGVLTERELRQVLEQRLRTMEHHYMHDAQMFKNLAKFPPAFGLMATTLGMISLLQKIGAPDSQKMIGPAMSIGLIGTLYGIVIANLVLTPIGENLTELTREEMALRRLIVEGAILLKGQSNPIAFKESLNSFVLPKNRVGQYKSGGNKGNEEPKAA